MDKYRIKGGYPLYGDVVVSGAKNAALPIIISTMLIDGAVSISNIPEVRDVKVLFSLLKHHGVVVNKLQDNTFSFQASDYCFVDSPYELVKQMRASVLILAPLVAMGRAYVSLPGGCSIGDRPIDFHLDILKEMGAVIKLENGYIDAMAPNGLKGANFSFPFPSVGATETAIMAAVKAKGYTVLDNCAREPEIIDLCNFLISCGAKIKFNYGKIEIKGVKKLFAPKKDNWSYKIISDRIEAGSYAIAAAATGGEICLKNFNINLLRGALPIFNKIGINLKTSKDGIYIKRDNHNGLNIETGPFPNFPTDLQAQTSTYLTSAKTVSIIKESIFERRFMYVPELRRMGAKIDIVGSDSIVIHPTKKLTSAPIMSSDLRAGMALVIAALMSEGITILDRIYHIDRGYENLERKLLNLGAHITKVTQRKSSNKIKFKA